MTAMENEPFAYINTGEERHEIRQDNAVLYNHLGRYALYNHLFVTTSENSGVYIWAHNPMYEDVARLAVENECQLVLNIREPAELDVDAYVRHTTKDLKEFDAVPEDWI